MTIKELYDDIENKHFEAMMEYMDIGKRMKQVGSNWADVNHQTHLLGEIKSLDYVLHLIEEGEMCEEIKSTRQLREMTNNGNTDK